MPWPSAKAEGPPITFTFSPERDAVTCYPVNFFLPFVSGRISEEEMRVR